MSNQKSYWSDMTTHLLFKPLIIISEKVWQFCVQVKPIDQNVDLYIDSIQIYHFVGKCTQILEMKRKLCLLKPFNGCGFANEHM